MSRSSRSSTAVQPAVEPARTPTRPRWRARLEVAAALFVVGATVAAVHWPVLSATARSLDDDQFVASNPLVTHPGAASTVRFFKEVLKPSTVSGYYLPLTMTSLMVDYALGGRPENPRVFHITNLTLHVLNTLLVFLLLRSLFGTLVPAALAALLFGLHPLTVESMAWVAERKTLLAAFFALASTLCYVEWQVRNRRAWMTASIALYVLALLSKPTVTMLPILLALMDVWPLKRFSRGALIEKWPYLLITVASGIITLVSHQRSVGLSAPGRGGVLDWPFQASYLLAFYIRQIASPTRLSCIYPEPLRFSLATPDVLWSFVAVCALTLSLAFVWRRSRGPLIGWLFFCAAIAPTLGLIQYSWVLASDKYVYWPAFGILMVVGAGFAAVARTGSRAKTVSVLLPVVIVLGLEVVGVRIQLRHWKDTLALFSHMETISPYSPVLQNNLGTQYALRGKDEEAIRHFRAAIQFMPDMGEAHLNLGIALRRQGKLEESIQSLRKGAEIGSTYPPAALQLGESLLLAGKLDEAGAEFRRALRLLPEYPEAHAKLGALLDREGRTSEAIDEFRAGLASAPDDAALRFGMAMALQHQGGSTREAMGDLRKAIAASPDWADPQNALAWILATDPDPSLRNPAEAVRLAARAVELSNGGSANALDTQAAALAAAGEFDQAIATASRAIELASKAKDDVQVRATGDRLKLYERHLPYTEAPAASPNGIRGSR